MYVDCPSKQADLLSLHIYLKEIVRFSQVTYEYIGTYFFWGQILPPCTCDMEGLYGLIGVSRRIYIIFIRNRLPGETDTG